LGVEIHLFQSDHHFFISRRDGGIIGCIVDVINGFGVWMGTRPVPAVCGIVINGFGNSFYGIVNAFGVIVIINVFGVWTGTRPVPTVCGIVNVFGVGVNVFGVWTRHTIVSTVGG
jgi:hypothetical protein